MKRQTLVGVARAPLVAALLGLTACATAPERGPMPTVDAVDLERFMGDWYVIASIPTFLETGAHNAVESYRLAEDGSIATTFTFLDGSFEGPRKTYTPRGFVRDRESNARWGMQFIWPFEADYRIAYLDADYSQTIIARQRRDYVWIMARSPSVSDEDFARLVREVDALGYDVSELRRVPQRW